MSRGTTSLLRSVLAAAAGGAVALGLSLPASAAGSPGATSAAAVSWYRGVVTDLHPLQSALVRGLQAASGWQQGSESASTARRELTRDVPRLAQVHGRLSRLAPLPGHRGARDDYVAAVGLYLEAFRLELSATGVSSRPYVTQLQRSFQRVRELGDVTFDQGTAELAPLLGTEIAGPDVQAAAHVPDWTALGLAPGPPLVSTWPAAADATSGTGSPMDWAAAVSHDGAPSQRAVQLALRARATHAAQSARLAVALGRAAASLGTVPGPPAPPQASALERLGLLVDAEALMSDEAGHGTGARALDKVGDALGAIGARLRTASASAP